MADANSRLPAASPSPRRRRKWGSLLGELPYLAIVIIGVIGISWTLSRRSVADYWVTMTPITALLCVAVGWAHLPHGRGRFEMVAIQLAQWAAVLVAMYLIHVSNVDGLVTNDALGGMMLTLLALGVFISGLDLRDLEALRRRRLPRLAVPFVAWFEQAGAVPISHRRRADRALGCSSGGGAPRRSPRSRLSRSPQRLTLVIALVRLWSPVKRRHVFVIAPAGTCAGEAGWRLKDAVQRAGTGKPAGRGSFAIALRAHRLGPRHCGRRTCGEFGRVAEPSLASSGDRAPRRFAPPRRRSSRLRALGLRAGRPQLRAAGGDRVAAVQGDQGLEDRDAARERAERRVVVRFS